MKSILRFSSLLILPVLALAQGGDNSALTVVLPSSGQPEVPSVSLGLQANEMLRTFSVSVRNDEEQLLKVFGVQTTGGLYVVDYPKEIGAHAQGTVTLLYLARQNASATADLVRLMTNRGEKMVQLDHGREPAVAYDTTTLRWAEGDAGATKSVVLTMLSSVAVPKGVRALGVGNSAVLVALGENRYRIDVTPASTAKAGQFPVLIQFAPLLPDMPATISCVIAPRE